MLSNNLWLSNTLPCFRGRFKHQTIAGIRVAARITIKADEHHGFAA